MAIEMSRAEFAAEFAKQSVGEEAWNGLSEEERAARIAEAERGICWLGQSLFDAEDAALLSRVIREGAGILKVQHAWRLQDIRNVIQGIRGETGD